MTSKTFLVTANRLADGLIVFLDRDGGWSLSPQAAQAFEQGADVDAAVARAQRAERENFVVALEPVEIETVNGAWRPVHLRDRIRCNGPTIVCASQPPPIPDSPPDSPPDPRPETPPDAIDPAI